MQIIKSKLSAKELAAINAVAENRSLKIDQTETHFFFPLRTLTALQGVRPSVINHSDTFKNTTVFFDVSSRNAEISSFVFDSTFEKGGYHVEFEISEETLIDLCIDLDLFETDGDGNYYTYQELSADEHGERDSVRHYQDLSDLVNGAATYEHADIFKAYIQQKGMEQVDWCRAASLENEQPKEFKGAISASLIERENEVAVAA